MRLQWMFVFAVEVLWFASPALAGNWGENWGTMVWEAAPVDVPTLGLLGVGLLVLLLGVSTVGFLRRRAWVMAALFILLAVPLVAAASTIAGLNIFANGQPADAEEVNDNFEIVKVAVNDNDSRVTVVEGAAASAQVTANAAQATADAAQVQIASTCPAGSSIRAIAADGSVDCEVDTDTTYSAADGVILTGTTFTADPLVLQGRINSWCPAGSSIRKVTVLGNVTCETDTDTQLSEATVDTYVEDNGYASETIQGPHDRPGSWNTAVGEDALLNNTIGYNNTAIGKDALLNNSDGFINTAVGMYALRSNTTGDWNTALGAHGLRFNTTGFENTAVGTFALQSNTEGSGNTAIGYNALFGNTEGGGNTASGDESLTNNSTGSSNTANGNSALYMNSTGSSNTGMGLAALYFNGEGVGNTGIGTRTLIDNMTGSENTAIGRRALGGQNHFDVNNNIAIGSYAGSETDGDDNVLIGHVGVASENGIIRIGTSGTHTETHLVGDTQIDGNVSANDASADRVLVGSDRPFSGPGLCEFDIVAGNPDSNMNEDLVIGAGDEMYFVVDGEGGCGNGNGSEFHWATGGAPSTDIMTLNELGDLTVTGSAFKPGGGSWSNSSDIRLKDVKGRYDRGLRDVMQLRTIRFQYKEDNPRGLSSGEDEIGFVAQEVKRVFPEAVDVGRDGYLDFNMHPLNVAMVNAIQELKIETDASHASTTEELVGLDGRMEEENAALRTELAHLKVQMAELRMRLDGLGENSTTEASP